MTVIPCKLPYGYLPADKRGGIVPERGVSSIYPAADFNDAFITGNGRQRIDILGDPYDENITYHHEYLYEPVYAKAWEPPDFSGVMPEIRRLLREGKYGEASALADREQRRQGFDALLVTQASDYISCPKDLRKHQAFNLDLRLTPGGRTENYIRYLDMMSGECVVRWENEAGPWKRSAFVSYEKNISILRVTPPDGLSFDAELVVNLPVPAGETASSRGSCLQRPELCDLKLQVSACVMTVSCAYCPEYGAKGYIAVTRVIGGTCSPSAGGMSVKGAESLTLITRIEKLESDFSHKIAKRLEAELMDIDADYDALLAKNRAYIGSRMEKSRVSFGPNGGLLSAEELIREQHKCREFSPGLLEKLYDMGRFFQITGTGELPPHRGHHNINTNLQVCAGNMTGLWDEMDVYFRFYEGKFDDFRTNAKRLFGARGLLASVHCEYDHGLLYHFSRTFPHYCWTGCLGWIYNEFWGHYLITGDREFLKTRIVPALKEIALFFEDYACDKEVSGRSIFYPSFSPENPTPGNAGPRGSHAVNINSVMDIMICREVLDNLIDGCNELGVEQENIAHWIKQRDELPDYLLDEEGGLKEWAWPGSVENYNHRHVSHHYDVWPGHAITWEDTPELAEAVLISNRKRGQQNDSAHGIIHRLFTAIRLKHVGDTVSNLGQLMEHGFLTRTLNTYHYPYRTHFPDLLGAMPAILAEMAIYSAPGVVEFLPAMPLSLSRGRIEGVWLFTFAKVNVMEWDLAKGVITAELVSSRDQDLRVRYRAGFRKLMANGKTLEAQGNSALVPVKAGQTVRIEIISNL